MPLAAGEMVEVGSHASTRSGVTLREKREVRVEAGSTKQEIGTDVSAVTTRFVQRVNLVRRMLNADSEEVQVREFVKESVNFAGQAPAPDETTALLGATPACAEEGRPLGLQSASGQAHSRRVAISGRSRLCR